MAIVNYVEKNTIQEELKNSPFEFYLTGSRFFGGEHEKSDWDFFVQDNGQVRAFLISLGFEIQNRIGIDPITDEYNYSSMNALAVMPNFHIQLVKDAHHKNEAQKFLRVNSHLWAIPKGSRKFLWDMALNATRSCD